MNIESFTNFRQTHPTNIDRTHENYNFADFNQIIKDTFLQKNINNPELEDALQIIFQDVSIRINDTIQETNNLSRYANYLAENVGQLITYSEYIADKANELYDSLESPENKLELNNDITELFSEIESTKGMIEHLKFQVDFLVPNENKKLFEKD